MSEQIWRKALVFAVVVLVATPLLTGVVAADERAGGTVVVEEGETVTDGLQATGGTVIVRGTVQGDLEAFAGTVVVADTGRVTGSLRGAAGSVRVAGTVAGDVEIAAGSVTISESGIVGGDVEVATGSFALDGRVDGTVRVGAGSIALGSSASVGGDFVYDGDLTRAPGATIGGELREDPTLGIDGFPVLPAIPSWLVTLYSLLLSFAVGAVMLLAARGSTARLAERATTEPLRTAGAGFLALVAVPMLAVFFLITVVGIPVALLLFLLYVVVLLLAFVLGEYAVGHWLLSLTGYENRFVALAVGILAVFAAGYVPILGGLVEFGVLLLGLGGVALGLWRRFRGGGEADDAPENAGADAETA